MRLIRTTAFATASSCLSLACRRTITATSRLAALERRGGGTLPRAAWREQPVTRSPSPPALENFPSGDASDTQRINELLEHHIRQAPDQYLWVHRRFKTSHRAAHAFTHLSPDSADVQSRFLANPWCPYPWQWSAMGDVIIATALFEDIARAFPDREIHLNTLPAWQELFAQDSRFQHVFAVDLRDRRRTIPQCDRVVAPGTGSAL